MQTPGLPGLWGGDRGGLEYRQHTCRDIPGPQGQAIQTPPARPACYLPLSRKDRGSSQGEGEGGGRGDREGKREEKEVC